jgi:hypothetical protein
MKLAFVPVLALVFGVLLFMPVIIGSGLLSDSIYSIHIFISMLSSIRGGVQATHVGTWGKQ